MKKNSFAEKLLCGAFTRNGKRCRNKSTHDGTVRVYYGYGARNCRLHPTKEKK